jgi:hypothetical protein
MYKKHKRYNFCENLEKDIQYRASHKDIKFKLEGTWKVFVRNCKGFKVYAVVGEWVRSNLSVIFGHGGHGYVHEFIPLNEIWIDIEHHRSSHYDCGCSKRYKGGKVSEKFFNEVVKHEVAERIEMEKGTPYWKAHQIALKKEKE